MKQLTCYVLGYGERGKIYSSYSIKNPDLLKVDGVIELNYNKRMEAKEKHNLKDDNIYSSLDEFVLSKKKCDFVINSTMDQMHYETSAKLLKAGYNLLLEKPITADYKELLELEKLAKENGCKVIICHVLRYTEYYRRIKSIIDSGELGNVVNLQMNEHISHRHFINSYVRGKWCNSKECGSGLLLAKTCHDIDLACWLNNATEPESVQSFGSRRQYCPDNAPKGSTEYCCDCPLKNDCDYEAINFEFKNGSIPYYAYYNLNKPIEAITDDEKLEYLKYSDYGRCVYKTRMDVVDRQTVNISFKDGSLCVLSVIGGACKPDRHLHVICERGEIVGYINENKFIVRKYRREDARWSEKTIDLSDVVNLGKIDNATIGHYGGDYNIMVDVVKYFNGENASVATTVLSDSINGHMVCYAAEKSREEKRVVDISEFYDIKD